MKDGFIAFKGRERDNLLVQSHESINYKFGTLMNNLRINFNQNDHVSS